MSFLSRLWIIFRIIVLDFLLLINYNICIKIDAIWEEVICDSLADMNVFSGSKMWAEAAEHMGMTIPAVQKAVSEGKANQTRGSPEAEDKASKEISEYTEKEYKDYGWARANEILSESETLRSLFADAVSRKYIYPQTPQGEYMIAVGDDAKNKVVYMNGTITEPIITRVLQIYEFNETDLSEIRRFVYEIERAGFEQQTADVFERYNASDFGNYDAFKKRFSKGARHSDQLGIDGRTGSTTTEGTFGKPSRELDTDYLDAVKSGDMETAQKMVDEAA